MGGILRTRVTILVILEPVHIVLEQYMIETIINSIVIHGYLDTMGKTQY